MASRKTAVDRKPMDMDTADRDIADNQAEAVGPVAAAVEAVEPGAV